MLQKHFSKQLAMISLVLIVLSTALFSFSGSTGVESFTIHLNEKLMLREYVTPEAGVKTLNLSRGDAEGVLKVHYNHCGKTGIERSLWIQDRKKNRLKTWDFSDHASPVMDFKVKELLTLSENIGNHGLYLVYTSREIPGGVVLASVVMSDRSEASLN